MEIVFRPAIASRGAKFTEHVNSRLSKIESFQEIIEEYKAGRAAGKCGPQLIAEKPKIMIDHGQALPSVKPFIAKTS